MKSALTHVLHVMHYLNFRINILLKTFIRTCTMKLTAVGARRYITNVRATIAQRAINK